MRKLAETAKNVARVIDLLNERLAFERTAVRLYDRILIRMRLSEDPEIGHMIARVRTHRDEEKDHEEWLEEQIRALRGDDHLPTERSVLVLAESQGIERVVHRDPRLSHDFHALLSAELTDNAGWDLLVRLADEFGDHAAKIEFSKRLREENEHVLFVRKVVEDFTKRELLGQPMPASI